MADDLKPCPFCGGEAYLSDDASHSLAYFIGCKVDDCFGEIHWEQTKAEAIAAWNRRATPTVQEAAKVLLAGVPNPIFDDLKPILMGEFEQEYNDGEDVTDIIQISWDVTKQIIRAALRAIAGDSHE